MKQEPISVFGSFGFFGFKIWYYLPEYSNYEMGKEPISGVLLLFVLHFHNESIYLYPIYIYIFLSIITICESENSTTNLYELEILLSKF